MWTGGELDNPVLILQVEWQCELDVSWTIQLSKTEWLCHNHDARFYLDNVWVMGWSSKREHSWSTLQNKNTEESYLVLSLLICVSTATIDWLTNQCTYVYCVFNYILSIEQKMTHKCVQSYKHNFYIYIYITIYNFFHQGNWLDYSCV